MNNYNRHTCKWIENNEITPELIYSNDKVYNFLVLLFLEELSNQYFQNEIQNLIDEGKNERWLYSQYMVSWLPYEEDYEKLLIKIKSFAAATMANESNAGQ